MARAVQIVEFMGVSEESFSDAVRQAVREASKTIDNITGVEVVKSTAQVDGDELFEFHVTVRLAFALEGDQQAETSTSSSDDEQQEEEE
jgi:flavin-binding protein dodecin